MSAIDILFGGAWKFYTYISPAIVTALAVMAYYYYCKFIDVEQKKKDY